MAQNHQQPIHIFLATPCYGGVVTEGFASGLVNFSVRVAHTPGYSLTYHLLKGVSLVTQARNILVAHFLSNPQYTHMLFIDSDIAFTTEGIFRLLEASKSKPIVGGTYPKKALKISQMCQYIEQTLDKDPGHKFTVEELNESMLTYTFSLLTTQEDQGSHGLTLDQGFIRLDEIPTGFMMLRRDVLVTMTQYYRELQYRNDDPTYSSPALQDKFYGFFDTMLDPSTGHNIGEDFAFCRRARALGYEVWMDLLADLKHESSCFTFKGNVSKHFTPINTAAVPAAAPINKADHE